MLRLNFSIFNFQNFSPNTKIIWLTTTTLPHAITEDYKMSTSSSRRSLERHLDMTVIQMFPYSVLYLAVRWERWWQTNITYLHVASEETRSATLTFLNQIEKGYELLQQLRTLAKGYNASSGQLHSQLF